MRARGGRERDVRIELRSEDRDPADRQPHLPRLAELESRDDLDRFEVEVRLVEAVEQDEPVGPGIGRRSREDWRTPSRTG